MDWKILPTLNALLNTTSALLLISGFLFIRHRKVNAHRTCMLGAFIASGLFFLSYLVYHAHAGTTRFMGTGWIRLTYFFILTTHTILAGVIIPLALITLYRALKSDFSRHRAIALWTLPLWLYVSVTGVLIYLMLYHWFPSR